MLHVELRIEIKLVFCDMPANSLFEIHNCLSVEITHFKTYQSNYI